KQEHCEMAWMAKYGRTLPRPQEWVPGTFRVISVRMNAVADTHLTRPMILRVYVCAFTCLALRDECGFVLVVSFAVL
ncbi:hypothetical protein, partial [Proteus mirabilis]|uniref:hypothetical protein n=1 Tax=Proteus mirabilis TaxID=584 RepID=UPI00112F20A0